MVQDPDDINYLD